MTRTPATPGSGPTAPATTTTTAVPRRGGGARGRIALVARTIIGAVLLLAGAAMLVLPGPGLLVIVAGLSLLAVDYLWAQRLRTRAVGRLAATRGTIRRAVTARRGRRHDEQDGDRPADTDHRTVRDRDPGAGTESRSTGLPS